MSGLESDRKTSGPILLINAVAALLSRIRQIVGPFISTACVFPIKRTRTAPRGSCSGNFCFLMRPKRPRWIWSAKLLLKWYKRCLPKASTVKQSCPDRIEAPSEKRPCGDSTSRICFANIRRWSRAALWIV